MVSRALACLVGASALAQATHVVGPGGFAQVQNALQVASPGDVIVVLPGFYLGFTANIGVTVVAAVPGTVTLGLLAVNFNLPPAQEARHSGMCLDRSGFGSRDCAGFAVHGLTPGLALLMEVG